MLNLYKYITLLLLFLYPLGTILSQVTIGSEHDPATGSLLDLKEYLPDGNNTTSTKGLLLPRVSLKKMTGPLAESLGAAGDFQHEAHRGLMVYHIDDPVCPTFGSGVYTWNGSAWERIGDETQKDLYSYVENTDGTGIVTDYEGNQYPTKRFVGILSDSTAYNQVWTTRNIRSLKDANGMWIDCPGGLYINPARNQSAASGISAEKVVTTIPDSVIGIYINASDTMKGQSYNEYVNEFGLYYTMEQGRKACPKGWHLPDYQEWKDLVYTMGGDTLAIGPIRANPGKTYGPAGATSGFVWGNASATPNGFNAIPAGYVDPGETKSPLSFGEITGFYGLDALVSINWRFNYVIFASNPNPNFHYSIRCVKDKP